MEDLTAIQPYSGWRNSATQGEAEALDYVTAALDGFGYLQDLGLELERQSFHVFLGTELWETRLHLTVGGQEVEVAADGLRGLRDDVAQALRFDSDGTLNDSTREPVVVEGPVVLIGSASEISSLGPTDLSGKVVFLDYAVVDRALLGKERAAGIASDLLANEPAGLVLVTRFSNRPGESHGSFVGDLSALTQVEETSAPPTLYVRMEDLAPAGITSWDDLARVEVARLTWDADVFSPGTSGNLVARIPGADSSRAVILGAHIDSPNSPGAMDDGSGSAVLLEVARVLDAAQVQPAADLYLVWFGSEELGLYGSYHFVSTHQELLDRTLAMLQIDCLTRPLDGIDAYLNLVTWSYGRLGDDRLTWPDYLAQTADRQGVGTYPVNYYGVESDNTAFTGFDAPNANLILMDFPEMDRLGGVHYAGHIHDPYDTVDLAREMGDALEEMARVALAAAIDTGQEVPDLRVVPRPDRRALFVASHTESVHMAPTTFTDLGMALAWEGFDVDLIPYDQMVTPADLEDAALVVALPVLDYPSPDGDPELYDETWSEQEIAALQAYVGGGGLLVVTNSAHRLKYNNRVLDLNEDWSDANLLAAHFGVAYDSEPLSSTQAQPQGEHPLVEGVTALELAEANGVPFSLTEGQVLAQVGREVAVGLVDYGEAGGQVLVLADVGMLGNAEGEPTNLPFWLNLARFARRR
ncbi:MAG: M28 family peptidase [Anaerolineae bacterium]|nr:M28 family peptidase [Anaerolineae bacterium]